MDEEGTNDSYGANWRKRKADPTELFRKCLEPQLPAQEGLTTSPEKSA